tara:strand:+ start:43 stop:291 length:249 start_codon:yes stop_codon:yes gene_type:complete
MIRTNLVTHFICNECGANLEVALDSEKRSEKDGRDNLRVTGAAKSDISIQVKPCRSCIEKHTKPAAKLLEAIKELSANEGSL